MALVWRTPLETWFDSFWSEPVRMTNWVRAERTEAGMRVTAELPGFGAEDVSVEHADGVLEITAERDGKRRSSRITVGRGAVRAAMENGVLVVEVERSSERVAIQVGTSIAQLTTRESAAEAQ